MREYDGTELVGLHSEAVGRRRLSRRRPQADRHRRRLHRARRVGRQRAADSARNSRRTARARVAHPLRAAVRRRRRQRALVRDDRSHLPARRQHLDRDRRRTAELGAGGLRGDGLGRRTAGDQRLPRALQSDGARQEPALSRRAAGGEGRARLRHHQGGARRRSHPREGERQRRQPRRRRGARVRADPRVPVVSADNVWELPPRGDTVRRRRIAATRRCCR